MKRGMTRPLSGAAPLVREQKGPRKWNRRQSQAITGEYSAFASLRGSIDQIKMQAQLMSLCHPSDQLLSPSPDKSGGLNGSTQHSPEVLSAGISMAKFTRER